MRFLSDQQIGAIKSICDPLAPFPAREGESLRDHCLATALITAELVTIPVASSLGIREGSARGRLVAAALLSAVAGALHDIGKTSPDYVRHLRKPERNSYYVRHEVTSFIMAANALVPAPKTKAIYPVLGAILYHHHGLYDITEKLNTYLSGGWRAWPIGGKEYEEGLKAMGEAVAGVFRALAQATNGLGLSQYFSVREEALDLHYWSRPLRDVIGAGMVGKAAEIEQELNRMRAAVTPLLSNLMIADNVSAYCSVTASTEDEAERVRVITRHGRHPILTRIHLVVTSLSKAGLHKYSECVRERLRWLA